MPPLFIAEIAGESVVKAKVAYRYFRVVTVFRSLTLAVLFPLSISVAFALEIPFSLRHPGPIYEILRDRFHGRPI